MRKTIHILLISYISITTLNAQDTIRNFFVPEFSYLVGNTINSNVFIGGDNLAQTPIKKYSGFSMKIGIQNPGYKAWQQLYKCPYYGIGMSLIDLNSNEIGKPISTFAYMGFPFVRYKFFEFYGEFQQGIAFNWIPYHPIDNPKNIVVSTKVTAHTAASLRALFNLGNRFDLGFSFGFTHYSNGGVKLPNKGLNLYGTEITMRYHIQKRPIYSNYFGPSQSKKKNEIVTYFNFGVHQREASTLDTNKYPVLGLSAIYYIQHTSKYRNGLGLDGNYWTGQVVLPNGDVSEPSLSYFSLGLIWQPELSVGKLDLVGGLGIYAKHNEFGSFRKLYQRLGTRYNFNRHLSLGINVRAINFRVAEYLEFQLGYHF